MGPVSIQLWLLAVLLAAAFAVAIAIAKLFDYLRRQDAKSQARAIIEEAHKEIESQRREAVLQSKEESLQRKAEVEKELLTAREKLHAEERDLEKRKGLLDSRGEELQKQERMVEGNQRKITEKMTEVKRRGEELEQMLQEQRQSLHQVSGLSREEATDRLLKLLEQELEQQTGSIILKHEKQIAEITDQKSRELLLTSIQRYAASHTSETTTSTVDIPNDEMKGRIYWSGRT